MAIKSANIMNIFMLTPYHMSERKKSFSLLYNQSIYCTCFVLKHIFTTATYLRYC